MGFDPHSLKSLGGSEEAKTSAGDLHSNDKFRRNADDAFFFSVQISRDFVCLRVRPSDLLLNLYFTCVKIFLVDCFSPVTT